ncbi:Uncharacterised protein [Mycobacteroides abscessus subsp. abscessus]|nr:Uncharacterised protein [Mycobacteroides abscessus subsp. abscessus]
MDAICAHRHIRAFFGTVGEDDAHFIGRLDDVLAGTSQLYGPRGQCAQQGMLQFATMHG